MPSEHARHWPLDPRVDFLNHGSYGAAPRVVLEAQATWRLQLEQEPVRFLVEQLEPALGVARAAVGSFVGAEPDDLAFVTNATTGVNTVLRSLRFASDDELLTTDHEYNAVRNALDYVAERDGARVVVAEVPFPISSPEAVVSAVMGAVTPRTRLDGARPSHVSHGVGAAGGNAGCRPRRTRRRHPDRWRTCARHGPAGRGRPGRCLLHRQPAQVGLRAEGGGFSLVRPDRQERIRPLVIAPRRTRCVGSVALPARVRLGGDNDPSAWLAAPAAIEFGATLLPGGWPAFAIGTARWCSKPAPCWPRALMRHPRPRTR